MYRLNGEEKFARRIAAEIVLQRQEKPIETTAQLASLIANVVTRREPGKHPATRSFQAIRIKINKELDDLDQALLNSIDIYFYANKVETSYINDVVKIFEKEDFVYEVSYDAPLIFLINDNFKKVKDWVLVLAIFFVFISILLINNTIRLSIYSKRMTIKTMQLVGATKSFIKRPFILTQIKLGFLSAIISSAFFVSVIIYFNLNYFNIDIYIIQNSMIISVVTSFILSFIISFISTNFITTRFLNSKIDKLY